MSWDAPTHDQGGNVYCITPVASRQEPCWRNVCLKIFLKIFNEGSDRVSLREKSDDRRPGSQNTCCNCLQL